MAEIIEKEFIPDQHKPLSEGGISDPDLCAEYRYKVQFQDGSVMNYGIKKHVHDHMGSDKADSYILRKAAVDAYRKVKHHG